MNSLLRYPGQNIDKQPFACVTASTGKAASNISGFTVHSALNFSTNKFQSFASKNQPPKVGHSMFVILQHKYHYMKVFLIDEISMLKERNIRDIDMILK